MQSYSINFSDIFFVSFFCSYDLTRSLINFHFVGYPSVLTTSLTCFALDFNKSFDVDLKAFDNVVLAAANPGVAVELAPNVNTNVTACINPKAKSTTIVAID